MGSGRKAGQNRPPGAVSGVLAGALARPTLIPAQLWPGRLFGQLRDAVLADARAEAASGRLVLWLPVAFGCGILIYFGAAQEPSLPVALGAALAMALAAGLARRQPVAFAILLALASLAAGFALATLHTARINHPVLQPPPGPVRLTGYVEQVERRAKADRILLRVTGAEGRGLSETPELVRLSLGRGYAPPAGSAVTVLARLLPPMEAALPGGYDFGRNIWFRGIDGVGFAMGRPRLVALPGEPPFSVRMGRMVEQVRQTVGTRIRASLEGTPAAIAVALVVGDRTAIPPEVEEGMRVSGLTHVLSISGLHMAMVAGTLFFLLRGLLALVPVLALRFPIKSLAALGALAGCAVYLLLSGNDWPAQRSFFMLAIVLLGVLAGRPALTLRTVAVAAMLVMAFGPQAILEPGTQMSFAATLALVAAYEQWSRARARPARGSLFWWSVGRCLLFLAALSLTSVVAGAATAPYAAAHFQRVGVYGLLANVAAMPAVEFLVMPFGLLGVLLMPFGWDFIAWPVMGFGIEIMMRVSDFVAALPGADARTDWMGAGAVSAITVSLLCLCLLRGWMRALALPPAMLALMLMGPGARPDVLVAPNGLTVAVRGADGRLTVAGARSNRLRVEQWLSREADPRTATAPDLASGFACTAAACRAALPGGGDMVLVRKPDMLAPACGSATFLVTALPVPADCAARVYGPEQLAATGTLALYRERQANRPQPSAPVAPPGDPGTAKPESESSGAAPEVSIAPAPQASQPQPSAQTATMLAAEAEAPRRMRPRRMAADHRASLRRAERERRAAALASAQGMGATNPSAPIEPSPAQDGPASDGPPSDPSRAARIAEWLGEPMSRGAERAEAARGASFAPSPAYASPSQDRPTSNGPPPDLSRAAPIAEWLGEPAPRPPVTAEAAHGLTSGRHGDPPSRHSDSVSGQRTRASGSGPAAGPSGEHVRSVAAILPDGRAASRGYAQQAVAPPAGLPKGWREVPTRPRGVQRPWMPALPSDAEPEAPVETANGRAQDDAETDE
ncbi:ComEC/Rec2 family competence protein [Xanthobacteraceae bacterium A53D]